MIRGMNHVSMIALATAVSVGAASAQDATTDASEEQVGVDRIIVTADRRARSLQEVPIAVTALSDQFIRDEGVADLEDLANVTPALSIQRYFKGAPQIFLRGIGSNERGAGGDPSVGIFIDDVYVGRAASAEFDYVNIERIEVLRGPQGALYGKNVVGGAINVITQTPSADFSSDIEVTIGNYNALHMRGSVNGALRDNVYANLAFGSRRRDGYIENAFTGTDLNDEDSQTIRGQVLFDGGDRSLRLSADYNRDRAGGLGRETEGFLFAAASPDRYVVEQDIDGSEFRDVWGVSAHARSDTAWGEFLSISAYRAADSDHLFDLDGLSPATTNLSAAQTISEEADQFSQEFRLTSTPSERLDTVLGLYYFWEDVDRLTGTIVNGNNGANDQLNTTNSYAAFGHLSWAFNDRWALALGGRYTFEEKDHQNTRLALGQELRPTGDPSEIVFAGDVSESWSNFSPQATLEFQATDDLFLFGTVSRGFKSGGFSEQPTTLIAAETPTDQETATNFELGAKSTWFDDRLLLNAALFYIDYEDLQVSQLVPDPNDPNSPGVTVLRNAATATSQGLELEFSATPWENVSVTGHYAYVDATYDEFIDGAGRDNSGNQLTRHPKHQGFVAVETWRDLANGDRLSARLSASAQSEVFIDPENNPIARLDPFELVNLRLAYEWDGGPEVALWARNLFDTYYEQHAIDLPANSAGRAAVVGEPLTFGVQLRWRTGG